MQNNSRQSVGVIGSGALAATAVRQLSKACDVVGFDPTGSSDLKAAGATVVDSLAAVGKRTTTIILADDTSASFRASVLSADGLVSSLQRGTILVDLALRDPAEAQAWAKALAEAEVSLVDAPLHCELMERFPENAAILCGGSAKAVAAVLPVLHQICAKVVVCGDVGAGHVARAIVGAVAVCNRLVTYEASAMGKKNGLSVEDMGTVLNRCSAANSATARVLPAIPSGRRTSDVKLGVVAREMAIVSELGRRSGAPILLAHAAMAQVKVAATSLEADADLDDLIRIVETASDLKFAA
jgi:3-hydroxyisobutyrate dehydrogenase-like beta-hydroxyacid dehydrogenase